MTQFLFSKRARAAKATCCAFASAVLLMMAGASPASAGIPILQIGPNTSHCAYPSLTQPFLNLGDANWYALTPGQSVDKFDGAGWTLSGGAKIVSAPIANGKTSSVLSLPNGGKAVSPPICVDRTFKTARTYLRSAAGSPSVQVYATYDGLKVLNIPLSVPRLGGTAKGTNDWAVSDPVNLNPNGITGNWQVVRFTITSSGAGSQAQLYNFWVDPRMK